VARPRKKDSGKWEIGLRHPTLPGGRKYFTFDTEAEAITYAEQWKLMKMAGVSPPAELMKPAAQGKNLGFIVRQYANSGLAAPSAASPLGSVVTEVGATLLEEADYGWLMKYVLRLKTERNLAPNSIRHRVQGLGRAIDEYLRNNPGIKFQNPVKLLPKGYSTYNELDAKLVTAAGKKVKVDVSRDRRLGPGEQDRIVRALSGYQREDRERPLMLKGGNALLTMFLLIVYSGVRLREAYTLTRGQIDLVGKVMRVRSTKQWRGRVKFRDVPMRPEVHQALVNYLSTRSLLPAANLFPFMEEEPDMTLTQVTQRLSDRFKHAFRQADCPDLHEHDLRHEATCRWLELRDAAGNWIFRLEEINRIMGWAPNSTMAHRYASFRGTDLAARLWVNEGTAPEARAAGT
jgi:integrase